MRKVLLVEDSDEIHSIVKSSLDERYTVVGVKTTAEAIQLIENSTFDLVILDVNLPDGDGFHLCTQIRNLDSGKEIPIIFVTGRTELIDKIMGFTVGADDYLVKPFHRLELRARVDAKLNKIKSHEEAEESIRRGNLRISLSQQSAFMNGPSGEQNLRLTPIEFKILYALAKNPEHVLSRDQLMNAAWGNDVHIVDRTVDKHISSLRKKLGPMGECVRTLPNIGYQFSSKH
jgi:DNA-binding response OmpR family regulator